MRSHFFSLTFWKKTISHSLCPPSTSAAVSSKLYATTSPSPGTVVIQQSPPERWTAVCSAENRARSGLIWSLQQVVCWNGVKSWIGLASEPHYRPCCVVPSDPLNSIYFSCILRLACLFKSLILKACRVDTAGIWLQHPGDSCLCVWACVCVKKWDWLASGTRRPCPLPSLRHRGNVQFSVAAAAATVCLIVSYTQKIKHLNPTQGPCRRSVLHSFYTQVLTNWKNLDFQIFFWSTYIVKSHLITTLHCPISVHSHINQIPLESIF